MRFFVTVTSRDGKFHLTREVEAVNTIEAAKTAIIRAKREGINVKMPARVRPCTTHPKDMVRITNVK